MLKQCSGRRDKEIKSVGEWLAEKYQFLFEHDPIKAWKCGDVKSYAF